MENRNLVGPIFLLATAILLMSLTGFAAFAEAPYKRISLKAGCPLPKGSSEKRNGVYQITLKNGMIGGCKSSDNKPRIRKNGEVVPFKERAEYRTPIYKEGRKIHYVQEFMFDPATKSGPRTTFFQIHQHDRNKWCKPNPGPAVMMQLDRNRVQFNLKINGGSTFDSKNYRQIKTNIPRSALTTWTRLEVWFDTTKDTNSNLSIAINGRIILKERIWFTGCGTPYIRTGLYRPGTDRGDNPIDRFMFKQPVHRLVE